MVRYLKLFETHDDYVAFTRTADFLKPNVSRCLEENDIHYSPWVRDYSKEYFTFEVIEPGTITIRLNYNSDYMSRTISYSTNKGKTWTDLTTSGTAQELGGTLNAGDKVLVKGVTNRYGSSEDGSHIFGGTAKVNVCGNIMSLLFGDDFADKDTLAESNSYTFNGLFNGYTNLLSAEHLILPATTLLWASYSGMFMDCTSLTTAPELPATTLAGRCYASMFQGCTSLTTAPELPATTLADSCYSYMFYGCTALVNVPTILPSTSMTNNNGSCYSNMFQGCTSLTTAPELPKVSYASSSYVTCDSFYDNMFRGCTSLNYVRCGLTTSFKYVTRDWLTGVAENGIYVFIMTTQNYFNNISIPSGWTIIYYDSANDKYYLDADKQNECDDHANPIS